MSGRKPDFEVKVGRRGRGDGDKPYQRKVGAAWDNRDRGGPISIVLDPGICIGGGEDVQITLWPPYEDKGQRSQPPQGGGGYGDDPGMDDGDIPF